MSYTRTAVSLNINGMKLDATQTLVKAFLRDNDVDIMFLQEVNIECSSFIHGYQMIFNPGNDERGTAVLIRVGLGVSQILMEVSGRITSLVIDNINMVNIYAPSGTEMRMERKNFSVTACQCI